MIHVQVDAVPMAVPSGPGALASALARCGAPERRNESECARASGPTYDMEGRNIHCTGHIWAEECDWL